MSRTLSILLFALLVPVIVRSQTMPAERKQLNHRIVAFTFPPGSTGNYTVQIAKGNFNAEDSFRNNIIRTIKASNNKVTAELPSFGTDYTWRVVYRGGKKSEEGRLNHFSILAVPETDTAKFRIRITERSRLSKDAYVFVDASRVLYTLDGSPVWFLPYIEGRNSPPRDLKLTPWGTVTFLIDDKAYEANYDGEIIWEAPNDGTVSGDATEVYHHEFTRLKNGHYMVMGNEKVMAKLPSAGDSALHFLTMGQMAGADRKVLYQQAMLGTIIEYDEQGKVVWSWKSSAYFTNKNLVLSPNPNGSKGINPDLHQNAFYFDEKTNNIYVCLKNINKILKVKYPAGIVSADYGEQFKKSTPAKNSGSFCGQHCCGISQKGYLYTFNNNDCNPAAPATVLLMQEPPIGKKKLKKMWEYALPPDNLPVDPLTVTKGSVGGNVVELPDQTLFVSTYSLNSALFIINQQKEVLWKAIPERWNENDLQWHNLATYRASIIADQATFEHFVWSEHLQ